MSFSLPLFFFAAASRAFSTAMSPGENVVVPLIAQTLEFALSSPPPLHQFEEPPLVVETDHLDLSPGKEVEEILAAQGHAVTDIIGKEKWVLNDPAKYEGLIPQNQDWTEFVDEKTGEWVYLDEYGDRIKK
jgi:heme/copper-type cytochrome/quinol oxidase subunit 1